jgi:putative flippase GtrA
MSRICVFSLGSLMTFFWYALAGGGATAVHYLALVGLVEWAVWPAPLASAVGALCGAAAAYAINRRITFTDSTASHRRALPRFLAVAVLGAALNAALVWAGVHLLVWHYLAAQAASTLVVLGLTFRLNRTWTFAR